MALLGGTGVARSGEPADPRGEPTVARARYLMGTVFRLEAPAGESPGRTGEALEDALDLIDHLEQVLSNWRPSSELSLLNERATDDRVEASPDLFAAIDVALGWAERTGGAFDPTVETLTRRFRGAPAATSASSRDVAPGDWREVHLDRTRRSVRLGREGAGIDLGGVGKGYALDRAAELLRSLGVTTALLDAGGQLLALGPSAGEAAWPVAVADPLERDRGVVPLRLRDVSVATSGNAVRPGEVVDPLSGASIGGRFSATAVALDATAADALSTALFVMGPERGLEWARGRDDVVALFVEPADGESPMRHVRSSRGGQFSFDCVLDADVEVEHGRRKVRVRCT